MCTQLYIDRLHEGLYIQGNVQLKHSRARYFAKNEANWDIINFLLNMEETERIITHQKRKEK